MIGLRRGVAKLVPYNKTWPSDFEKEKRILEKLLGGNALKIEHGEDRRMYTQKKSEFVREILKKAANY